VFGGGDYQEVGRWLRNFVASHAKRENPRAEAMVDDDGSREGRSYGVRLKLGEEVRPPASNPPLELAFADVAAGRGGLAWCAALAERVRALAREFRAGTGAQKPA